MNYVRVLFSLVLFSVSIQASAEFVGPLTPEQYDVYIFSNGKTFIEVLPDIETYLTGPQVSSCDATSFSLELSDEASNRIVAAVLAARSRNDLILVDMTDSTTGSPNGLCVLNGLRVFSADQ